jgi:pimeloyl-ACP methyl ester carboxylesterase
MSPDDLPITKTVLTIPGGTIAVHHVGKDDGIPVLFLHGNSLSSTRHPDWWLPLGTSGRRVIAIDFPGHGASPWCDGWTAYSLPELAGAVVEVLHQLDAERPVVVGHSLGGSVALEMGAQGLPLRGIATFGSPPMPNPLPVGGPSLPAVVLNLFTPDVDDVARAALGIFLFNGPAPDWWDAEFQATDPRVRSGLAAAFGGLTWRDQPTFLRRPSCPILAMVGALDPCLRIDDLRALDATWWGDGPQLIPGASHMGIGDPATRGVIEAFCSDCAH